MPDGNRYESALERDFMLLLKFDPAVDIYTPQPLTFKYRGTDDQFHNYTPDGLIEWRADLQVHDPRPVLVEVKYREAFRGDWRAWHVRSRAASNYAQGKGWIYKIFTEREIRTPFLDNARFLLPYRRRASSPQIEAWILDKLNDIKETTPQALIETLYQDRWNQAGLIPVVWRLLAERSIGCDLAEPLTMQSPLWTLRG